MEIWEVLFLFCPLVNMLLLSNRGCCFLYSPAGELCDSAATLKEKADPEDEWPPKFISADTNPQKTLWVIPKFLYISAPRPINLDMVEGLLWCEWVDMVSVQVHCWVLI